MESSPRSSRSWSTFTHPSTTARRSLSWICSKEMRGSSDVVAELPRSGDKSFSRHRLELPRGEKDVVRDQWPSHVQNQPYSKRRPSVADGKFQCEIAFILLHFGLNSRICGRLRFNEVLLDRRRILNVSTSTSLYNSAFAWILPILGGQRAEEVCILGLYGDSLER